MKRICIGTMINLFYQGRIRTTDTIRSIFKGIFAAYGLDIDGFNDGLFQTI